MRFLKVATLLALASIPLLLLSKTNTEKKSSPQPANDYSDCIFEEELTTR